MEMQQVRYFLSVAQTLNFTRAAEQCNVSQPALTRAIKLLEDELGGELIRREGRLSHLTDLGKRMLPLLRQCYDSALSAKALAKSLQKGEIAALNLAVAKTFDISLLLPALNEMYAAFPDIQLKLKRGASSEIRQMLEKGDADMAISGVLGESDRLDSWRMFDETFDIVVGADHDLARSNAFGIDAGLMRDERLLLCSGIDATEAELERLAAAGVNLVNAHEVDSFSDLEALVKAKFGIGLAPSSALRAGDIRHLRVDSLNMSRPVAIYAVAGRPRSREAAALLSLLRGADWSAMRN